MQENIFEKLIGKCTIYKDQVRAAGASYTAQEFNLLNDLNNLTINGGIINLDSSKLNTGAAVQIQKHIFLHMAYTVSPLQFPHYIFLLLANILYKILHMVYLVSTAIVVDILLQTVKQQTLLFSPTPLAHNPDAIPFVPVLSHFFPFPTKNLVYLILFLLYNKHAWQNPYASSIYVSYYLTNSG